MILHPSLASANPLHYGRELTALDNLDFGSLHLDIEDSSFINNITFGMKTVQASPDRRLIPCPFISCLPGHSAGLTRWLKSDPRGSSFMQKRWTILRKR